MRLLIYIHSLENGGAERVAANLANHWAGIGWEVTLVTVAPQENDFYRLDPRVLRIALNLAGGKGNLLAGFWRTARRVQGLRRELRRLRPDVALSVMQTASVVLALAARGMPELLAIGSEHNFPARAPLGIVWETLRRHAYARLAAVVALTSECADWLSTHTRARRVPVIPNPVCWPLPKGEPLSDPANACPPGRHVLLAVGRLSEEKNFTSLVASFARLAPRHPDWDLVILGDGPLRAELQAQALAAGLAGRVVFPGRVGNVGDWYARASLNAMSSHFEGFPNTLAEAMAYGLPAVSVDCDTGPRDIIRHGVDGFLVQPGDCVAMEAALDSLMRDSRLRERFAARAVDARERFSIDKIAGMWEALFLPGPVAVPDAARSRRHAATEPG
ncbi:glycosyltransferase family 4 protein [Massilia sp. IC2-477]|uniref:glycosyltransferase family 4 protein n=1 Tax=Massilia sp. IC2-477 TaxID=2887198 RepID=UPI001D11FE6D|nr:glycosyltransferase family 4 protein [Massilia sp. IC2-477]MCC2958543.1 glycosyltransferase family 4 protein [Massilia sp. IC2-477]